MKESIWGYWIIVLGISVIAVMVLLQSFTTTSEQDYYLVKSCLESSMYDAVDYGYYRDAGKFKMNAEKFYENFIRRFAQSVNMSKNYKLDFYDVSEMPPSASVSVTSSTSESNFGTNGGATESTNVTNRLTGILFTNDNYNPLKLPSTSQILSGETGVNKTLLAENGNFLGYYKPNDKKETKMSSCIFNVDKMKVIFDGLKSKNIEIKNYDSSKLSIACGESNVLSCCQSKKQVELYVCMNGKFDSNRNCSGTLVKGIKIQGGGMSDKLQ